MADFVTTMILWTLISLGYSLNLEETAQLVQVARTDRENAVKYYSLAVSEGMGPSQVDALYELYQLNSQSPESDFSLLLRLVLPPTGLGLTVVAEPLTWVM
jgi:hypothetical protein